MVGIIELIQKSLTWDINTISAAIVVVVGWVACIVLLIRNKLN